MSNVDLYNNGGINMKLKRVLASLTIYQAEGNLDIEIKGIETDSRKVKPGFLFVALRGFTVDGHHFIEQAKGKGAVAFLVEERAEGMTTFVQVPISRRRLLS